MAKLPVGAYQDLVPGSNYWFGMTVEDDDTLTGKTVEVLVDSVGGEVRVTGTAVVAEDGLSAVAALTGTDTAALQGHPGNSPVVWLVDGTAQPPVRSVQVTPMPNSRV